MGVSEWGAFKDAMRARNEDIRKEKEQRIIAKYKLKESIRAKLSKLGAEDLADDIFEYINLIKEE